MSSIILENITLDYPIFGSNLRLITKRIASLATAGKISSNEKIQFVRSLNNISLTINPGDKVALIGGNGAGKTSLLKVISGIFKPTKGKVKVNGNVTTILGFGFGLEEEATGYENIILGGLSLGYTIKQMLAKTHSIGEFTELGEFLNMPIKTYSSGMKARLAFAITISFDPGILIIDEGIGVGDKQFLNKAQKRIEDFLNNASTLILASHSSELLKKFCTRGLVLKNGNIKFDGSIDSALDYYNEQQE